MCVEEAKIGGNIMVRALRGNNLASAFEELERCNLDRK